MIPVPGNQPLAVDTEFHDGHILVLATHVIPPVVIIRISAVQSEALRRGLQRAELEIESGISPV